MPPKLVWLLGAVIEVSGLDHYRVFYDLPLSVVYAYEHLYLHRKGMICRRPTKL